jgi:hypothetical protein
VSVVALDRVRTKTPGWAVATQLARREGLRIIRHPIFLVGALLSLATFGLFTWQSAPVLHRDDLFVAGSLLPLAAASLIIANLAASRSKRNATDELYDGTVTSGTMRTIGHLLSLAYPALASLAVAAVMFAYMFLDAPVGTPRVAEILVGPFCVALLGAIGIAIGRWKSHPALGPMAVVAIGALETLLIQPIVSWQGTGAQTVEGPWFALWVPMSLTGQVPSELVLRPATWHLLFLGGLIMMFAALALGREQRGPRLIALLAAGVVAVVVGMLGQFTPTSDAERAALVAMVERPDEHQVCEERGTVTYCAYPAYVGWIDRWAAPVEGALALIPPDERPDDLVIRQRFGSYFEGPTDLPYKAQRAMERDFRRLERSSGGESILYTGTRWGRGETEGDYEIGLALHVAMTALDFPASRADMALSKDDRVRLLKEMLSTVPERYQKQVRRDLRSPRQSNCYTSGQARALAAWWIAAQSTPSTRASVLRSVMDIPYGLDIYEIEGRRIAGNSGSYVPLYSPVGSPILDRIGLGGAEFYYAAELLKQPPDRVSTVVGEKWSELSDPGTTTDSILDDLGLEAHPTIEEQIAALPDDVELERGHRRWAEQNSYMGGVPCR